MIFSALVLTFGWTSEIQNPSQVPGYGSKGRQMPSFEQFDLNNDGKISRTEFGEFRAERMKQHTQEDRMLRNQSNAPVFSHIDTDKDGFISKDEFKTHHIKRVNKRPNTLKPAKPIKQKRMVQMQKFIDFDLDNNGQITQNEFNEAYAKRIGKRVKEGKMMRNAANAPSFSHIDTNHDGVIVPLEFKAYKIEKMKKMKRAMDRKVRNKFQKNISDTFVKIDTDHSGQLSLEEFRTFRMKQIMQRKKRMMLKKSMRKKRRRNVPRFVDFDLDNNGKITRIEFDLVHAQRMNKLAQEGKNMRNAANAPSFSHIDTDKDGTISREEFRTHRKQQRNNVKKRMFQGQGMQKSSN